MSEDTTAVARQARRAELRSANLAAWKSGGIDADELTALDSSLKRNTAYIKRLRTSLQAADAVAALLNEVNSLSLEKYVSELVPAAFEGISRCKSGVEIYGAVDVLSALHQRFPQLFTVPLLSTLQAALQAPSKASLATLPPEQRERDENARILRQRSLLRVYAEMELVGIVTTQNKDLGEATFTIFKELLAADKDTLVTSIPLAVAFTKHLGQIFLPDKSGNSDAAPTPAQSSTWDDTLNVHVLSQVKEKFRRLLDAFYEALSRRAIKEHTHMLETDKRNHDAYIRSGEIFEDRAQTYEKMARNWDKLWSGVQSLADALALPLPTLPPLASNSIITGTGVSTMAQLQGEEASAGGAGSPWNDEEEKKFYTDLLDLRGEVPGALLRQEDAGSDAPRPGTSEGPSKADAKEDGIGDLEATADLGKTVDDGMAAGPAAQLTALLARLPEMCNRDAIDKAAVEFTFLNSKAARRRLVKVVTGLPRTRQDLIPYYSRLVATLNQHMPDVGALAVSALEDEFRYFQRKKGQDLAESRSKNIRFISELTKFGVTPMHSILHILKVCLDDFSGPNLDNLCTLLETCGRFLLRSDNTREKMAAMLDTLKRKRAVQNLDQRQMAMLDNAYYQCDPPDRPVVLPKERTPMQLYIHHLMYSVLSRPKIDFVVQKLRRLHWEDPLIFRKVYNTFTKVWKAKYGNIYLLAMTLHDFSRFRPDFGVAVVDGVLESIVAEMESNNFKNNQQRVSSVKYLGELYTYRVVESRVILDTLWTLATFGHPEGRPVPGGETIAMDPEDDYFRMRLVCTLLDTCGLYFDRGQLRKRMDNFLTFFQLYIRSKRQPLPMDVDFALSDTMEKLRPKLKLAEDYEAAAKAVDAMFASATQQGATVNSANTAEPDLSEGEDDVRSHAGEIPRRSGDEVLDAQLGGSSDTEQDHESDGGSSSPSELSTDEQDSDGDYASDDEEADQEQAEFDRELARLLAESGREARKTVPAGKNALTDRTLPVIRKQQSTSVLSDDENDGQHMKFTLLMKRGAKQQTRSMDVPRESALAMHTLNKQQQDKEEQKQLKELVLKYERQEEAESAKEWMNDAGRRGYRIRYG